MRNFLKRLINESIFDCLDEKFDHEDIRWKERYADYDKNVRKVNEMLLELKGVISMARASVKEKETLDCKVNEAFTRGINHINAETKKMYRTIENAFDQQLSQFECKYFVINKMQKQLNNIEKHIEKPKRKKNEKISKTNNGRSA